MRPLERLARDAGPLRPGHARVVVVEPDGRVVVRDFERASDAATYAADASCESEDDRGPPLVGVFTTLPG